MRVGGDAPGGPRQGRGAVGGAEAYSGGLTFGRMPEHFVMMPSTRTTELSSAEPRPRGETWCEPERDGAG